MLNKIATVSLVVIGCLLLANQKPAQVEVKAAAPIVVGSPPGELAALQTKIAALEAELAKRPTSLPTAACQCKPCQCEECACKPVKGERLPEAPYRTSEKNAPKFHSAPVTLQKPAPNYKAAPVYCSGGQCYSRRYVPQRRGLFGWRR